MLTLRKSLAFIGCLAVFGSSAQNVGINTNTPRFPLSFSGALGQKISLWDDGLPAGNNYGFGVQSGLLQIHTYSLSDDIVLGYGSSANFNEKFRFKGNGFMGIGNSNPAFLLDVSGRIRIRTDASNTTGVYFNNQANTGLNGFVGMMSDTYIGLWGSGVGMGLVMNTNTGYTGIGSSAPVNRLDVAGLNNWDLTNTEGDMRVGNASYRIKLGVALGGGGAGASGIMQMGGIGVLSIGAAGKYQVQLNGSGNFIDFSNIGAGIRLNGNAGSAGQVLTSGGNGAAPVWSTGVGSIAANAQAFGQSTPASNFTGYVAVPGLTQVVNTPSGRGMFIVKGQMINNGCFACGNASCKYDILVDGVLIDRNIIQVGNGLESVVTNGATFYNLAAGQHTFAVYVDGNGNNFSAYGFRLVYLVLPQ